MPITRHTFTTPFSYRRSIFAVIVSLAMGCSAGLAEMTEQQALGAFYYGAREYNLITFGDYNANGQDTWGAVAVGGNFADSRGMTLVNFSWGTPTNSNRSSISDPSVLVAGKLNLATGNETKINFGSFAYNPSKNTTKEDGKIIYTYTAEGSVAGHITLKDTTTLADWKTASTILDFSGLKYNLAKTNTTLGAYATTSSNILSSVSKDKQSIAVSKGGVSYLNVYTTDLNGKDLSLSIAKDSFLVINLHINSVTGNELKLGNVKLAELKEGDPRQDAALLDSSANRILWNIVFDDTKFNSLVVNTNDVYGSFLSLGTINANGRIWGQVIADTYNQSSQYEIHQALMEVNMTMIPEPSTIALGMGTLAMGFVFWRRRQQRKSLQA